MNRKFLENELLSYVEDESVRKQIIDNIMSKNGEDIGKHKVEVATLKNEIQTKQGVIDNLNEKIKENDNIDIEQIKKEQFDLGKAEGNKEVETFKKSEALKKALGDFKAKDIDLLSKLLNSEKITYEVKDGKYQVGGLQDQINEIKKTPEYLFEEVKQPEQRINAGAGHEEPPATQPTTLVGALREAYNK